MGSWQDLPSDLVRSVAAGLSGVDDLVRLGAVCRPWSAALTGFRPTSAHFPWLVPASPPSHSPIPQVPTYSPTNHRVNRFWIPTLLSGGFRVVGCHRGWLVAVDATSLHVHVFNPVTRDRAYLPSFSTLNETSVQVHKVALSSTPSADNNDVVVAAAIVRFDNAGPAVVVFAKVGDDAWSGRISLPFSRVTDVVYCRGNFFAMSFRGLYQIINHSGRSVAAVSLIDPVLYSLKVCEYFNLVLSPSSGHLLAVGRVVEPQSTTIVFFRKFNPDANSSSSRWVEIKDLGDESLFLGGGHAMLLPVGNNNRIRRNCIYFIYTSGSGNVEVFDIEKGVFEPSPLDGQPPPDWKRPLFWFLPSLS